MSSRVAVGIFLVQFFSVVVGFFVLGIVLKVNGYPNDYSMIRWTPFAVLMRERGLWLLLTPFAWSSLAVIANRSERGFITDTVAVVVGIVLSFLIWVVFLWASVHPYSRPLWIYLGPIPSNSATAPPAR